MYVWECEQVGCDCVCLVCCVLVLSVCGEVRMKGKKPGKLNLVKVVTHGVAKRRSDVITADAVRENGTSTWVHMGLGYMSKPLTMDMVGYKYGCFVSPVRLAKNSFLTDKSKGKSVGVKKPKSAKK